MSNNETTLNNQGVGVVKMAAFAIGSTLASGVFYLPGDLASGGGVGVYGLGMLLGWVVCGLGTLALVMLYYSLTIAKPELKSGIYAYAKEGFGDYIGFNMAWGYWASALIAQVTFCIALFTALGEFFPAFGSGNTVPAIIASSALIWLFVALISLGVKEALGINLVVVIAKLIPILTLIVAIIFATKFDMKIFMDNFTGGAEAASLFEQVKGTMFFTVWIFIGFEASIVASGRGKTAETAGKATLIAFICLLAIYIMISMLSMGVMPQSELAAFGANESLSVGNVMAAVVGPWGLTFVSIAVIISVGGAMYTYTLLCSECCFRPATTGTFPKFLAIENKKKAPVAALIFTIGVVQAFLLIVLFNESTYKLMYSISTCMIMLPYLVSALYFVKLSLKGENTMLNSLGGGKKAIYWFFAAVGTLYGVWMLFSSGWQYILITALLYAPGALFYWKARSEQGKKLFNNAIEVVICIIVVAAFIASVILIAKKVIEPF
ncbi:MAG: basic amino acid/polyamine antiporter [Anaerovoracaceae bacterium]